MKPFKTPFVATSLEVLAILAFLAFLLGIRSITVSDPGAEKRQAIEATAQCFGAALFCSAMGRVIYFLARTAYNTQAGKQLLEDALLKIDSIQKRLSSPQPHLVQMHQVRSAPPQKKFAASENYCIAQDGTTEGPFTKDQITEMASAGLLNETTAIMKEGDASWRTLDDYPELN